MAALELIDNDLVSKVFEGEKKDTAISLFKSMEDKFAVRIRDEMNSEMVRLGIRPPRRVVNKGSQKVRYLKAILDNGGVDPWTGERWEFKDFKAVDRELLDAMNSGKVKREDFMDFQAHGDQPLLFPRVVIEKVREAIEPNLLLTPLLQRINFSNGQQLIFPAVSSYSAGDLRIPENGEYPEGKMQFAGQMVAKIGKHGIKVSMNEEAMRYNIMDIWSMHLRAAGRALARHKEEQVVNQVFNQGTTYFNNSSVSARKTTGRDINGNFNATFTADDLFEMWADMIAEGHIPDLIIMHPFAWTIFARDPIMRNVVYMNGGSQVIANAYQGSPGSAPSFDLGGLSQERRVDEPANLATTFSPVPSVFPFGSVRILITPFVPFDRATAKTDIYLCDSRDLGIIVVDEEVVTEQWKDPEHDIQSIKFRERYGITTSNNGRAIRIARNVVVTKSYDFSFSTLNADVTLNTSEVVV